jgi:molybdate-binding protein/DNA-binding HxlR family transcriptional regulator
MNDLGKRMQKIDQLQQLKVLGDAQRLAILRRLMDRPATLSQLGEHLGESAAHIRHHLKALEGVGLVALSSTNPVRGFLEKYYRATERAYLIQMTILPETADAHPSLILGSNDPALQSVLGSLAPSPETPACVFLNLDSLEGLVKLREEVCEMATVHLLDAQNGEYNRAYVQHFFPGEEMALIRLFQREEGLLVQSGNPLQIRSIADLTRPGMRLVNRERGAGTRVWLDAALGKLGIPGDRIAGYAFEVHSHLEVGQAIAAGKADVGIGLPSSAAASGLEFIPLFAEPYDLVLPRTAYADPRFAVFFDQLASRLFQESIQGFAGYHGLQDRGQVTFIA